MQENFDLFPSRKPSLCPQQQDNLRKRVQVRLGRELHKDHQQSRHIRTPVVLFSFMPRTNLAFCHIFLVFGECHDPCGPVLSAFLLSRTFHSKKKKKGGQIFVDGLSDELGQFGAACQVFILFEKYTLLGVTIFHDLFVFLFPTLFGFWTFVVLALCLTGLNNPSVLLLVACACFVLLCAHKQQSGFIFCSSSSISCCALLLHLHLPSRPLIGFL